MKYFKENDKTPFVVVAFGICLYFLLEHLSLVMHGISYIGSVAFPFILGSCLAFIINVPMRFFENRVLHKIKKGRRVLSLIAAILCIIGVILLVCGLIIPELAETMYRLSVSVPGFIEAVQEYIDNLSKDNPRIHSYVLSLDVDWNEIGGQMMGYFQTWATNLLNSTVSIISSAVQVIVSFALGFVFALNALLKKETLAFQVKKLLLAFLPLKAVKHIVRVGRLSNQAFSQFPFRTVYGSCDSGMSDFWMYENPGNPVCSIDSGFYRCNFPDPDRRRICRMRHWDPADYYG